jgi:hypothetical protein
VRYDAEWRRYPPPVRYDQGYGPPRERGDTAFRQGGGGGWHDPEFEVATPPIYGPARYGLGPYHERLRRRRRSDEALKKDVEEALFLDTWVDADAITVGVSDGVVTLRGELPSYEEVRFATDDAWDIEGVIGVRTELRVAD